MFWLQFPSWDHHARYSNWNKLAIREDLFIYVRRTVLSEDFKLTNLTKRPNEPPVTVNKDLFPWAYTKFRDQVLIIALDIDDDDDDDDYDDELMSGVNDKDFLDAS